MSRIDHGDLAYNVEPPEADEFGWVRPVKRKSVARCDSRGCSNWELGYGSGEVNSSGVSCFSYGRGYSHIHVHSWWS